MHPTEREQETNEEKEFTAAFAADADGREAGDEEDAGAAPEREQGDDDTPHPAAAPGAKAAAPPAEPDPWEGVPTAVRQNFERLNEQLSRQEAELQRMRSNVGRIDNLQAAFEYATRGAAATAKEQGAGAPSKEEIRAAARSSEKFERLKEDYPEFGEALDEQFAALREDVLERMPQVDPEALKSDVLLSADERIQSTVRDTIERLKVEVRHPGWEDVVQSPEFRAWAYEGGPSAEERSRQQQLDATDPAQADAHMNDLIRRYPQWWADRGALMTSPKARDAVRLLDAFTEQTGAKRQTPADASAGMRRERQRRRLETSVAPTRGVGSASREPSEEDDFIAGFRAG